MFAVVLGLGVLSPAMADKPNSNGDHKVVICHYQEEKTTDRDGNPLDPIIPEAYLVIDVDNKGKMNGHFKNGNPHHFPVDDTGEQNGQGDFEITNDDEVTTPTVENDSVADCEALDAGLSD